MTVLELCEGNWTVGEIEVDFRAEPHGRLIKKYRIGSAARENMGDSGFDVEIITKQINHYEKSDGWGLIEKNIPKSIAELEVDSWMCAGGPKIKSQNSVKIYIHAHDARPLFKEVLKE